jgi:hypothetical protein
VILPFIFTKKLEHRRTTKKIPQKKWGMGEAKKERRSKVDVIKDVEDEVILRCI